MNMNFYAPVNIITGKDCVKNNAGLLKAYGKKCIIVTGKSSAKKCGALDDITDALKSQAIDYVIFDSVEQQKNKFQNSDELANLDRNFKNF